MSSQSDEENEVHPLVSNLLGQNFIPRTGYVLRYDREEMMHLSTAPLSMKRPDNLSVDFNGDDGKFSPSKWLEHRWEVEGIKNRAPTKKLQEALSAGAVDDNAGLSPQRRGFSGGCRAPADDKGKDGLPSGSGLGSESAWTGVEKERDRLSSTNSKSWRSGSNGNAEKYFSKGGDFKLPFQKSIGANTRGTSNSVGSWRTEMKDRGPLLGTGKYTQGRIQRKVNGTKTQQENLASHTYSDERDRGERIPEWADGSTTMDDMIELRGFEEPIKKSKRGTSSRKDEKEKEREKDKKVDTRKGSLENGKLDHHHVSENDETAPPPRPLGSVLPESDAELAAILGLLDVQDEGADTSLQDIRNSQDDPQSANPLLAKIFAQTPSSASQISQNVQGNPSLPLLGAGSAGVRAMRLEDLEKAFSSKDSRSGSIAKESSLQDPNQEAHLLSILQNFVKQEETHLTSGVPNLPNPALTAPIGGLFQPGGSPFLPPVLPPGAPMLPPALLARMAAENPTLMQAHIQAHVHQAMAAQLAANGGVNVPPVHMHEQARATLLRLQQQQLVAAAAAQGKLGKVRPPTQMIPSSVQRQMNKGNSSQHEETVHRNVRAEQEGSPPHLGDAEALETFARNNADLLKKMQMQHQYAAMMNAMQGGLPMAAWRPPPPTSNSGLPPNPQAQAQLFLQMTQMQQLALQQRIRVKQQQQAALAKIMQLQGHQQAAAAAASMQVPNFSEHSSQNFGGGSPFGAAGDLSGPIQSPLEKLLAAAGVQPAQFTGANHESNTSFQGASQGVAHVGARMPPPSVRPMSLEELERKLTEQTK
ncbi:unnamed protein product [Angiostrongylus costaricensis]|uniref:GYF domain-containing protein n=1 Tax=Angiostrongylus costaricensis TaxID=334426 RepID=A0A0R3PTB9_ANGCS|nr:unnamed protein product [Angiostrongylus costaricensis]